MTSFMNWKPENVALALEQVFGDRPMKRRKQIGDEQLDNFLDEVRFIVSERYKNDYLKSEEFKECIEHKIEEMLPAIRQEIERQIKN